ncbi:putative F-box domain-containing protein [Tanacetum coccineum]
MAELIPDDIYEKIFLRLDVRNLVRCKSVCKSWKSFISRSRFIRAQFNHSYNSNENGHKRIGEAVFLIANRHVGYPVIGSSNGLVCISDAKELLVANPLTREVKPLQYPLDFVFDSSCWGFGYDSITCDFKVVLGVMKGKNQTCFQVISLKSNAWKVIGEVDYICSKLQCVGVLCNGAIHWVMHPENNKKEQVILSFDLSKEEFEEIPQPDDARCKLDNACQPDMILGIMEECLCLECCDVHFSKLWVMKKYNSKESWVLPDNYQYKCEFGGDPWELGSDASGGYMWCIGNRKFGYVPAIVESLVSPHLQAENE